MSTEPRERIGWRETGAVLAGLEASAAGARLVPRPRGFDLVRADGSVCAQVRLPVLLSAAPGEPADAVIRRGAEPRAIELLLLGLRQAPSRSQRI